jgi:hypothetical protein
MLLQHLPSNLQGCQAAGCLLHTHSVSNPLQAVDCPPSRHMTMSMRRPDNTVTTAGRRISCRHAPLTFARYGPSAQLGSSEVTRPRSGYWCCSASSRKPGCRGTALCSAARAAAQNLRHAISRWFVSNVACTRETTHHVHDCKCIRQKQGLCPTRLHQQSSTRPINMARTPCVHHVATGEIIWVLQQATDVLQDIARQHPYRQCDICARWMLLAGVQSHSSWYDACCVSISSYLRDMQRSLHTAASELQAALCYACGACLMHNSFAHYTSVTRGFASSSAASAYATDMMMDVFAALLHPPVAS